VSKSTFFSHRRQARLEGHLSNSGSDADDDDSDNESQPLAPFAAAEPSEANLRSTSPYRRHQRRASRGISVSDSGTSHAEPPSPDRSRQTTSSMNAAPMPNDAATPAPIDAELSDLDVDGADANEETPAVSPPPMSPPPMSPPPSSSSEEEDCLDDIEHAIFSNFDIEDLLYAGQIEVQPWIRLGIVLLRWKSRKNISTHAYDELRHDLAKCIGIKVPSATVTIRHLQEIVGIYPVKIDCCARGCLAYVGRYRRSKKCATCGAKRYQTDRPGDEDFADVNLDDSELSDGAMSEDDLEEDGQVRSFVNPLDATRVHH
jgi:hypothetical protein